MVSELPRQIEFYKKLHLCSVNSEESNPSQPNNPLHGIKLADVVEYLVGIYGFERLGEEIPIRCFTDNPSIKSSLTFLRKTPWARTQVEALYLRSL
jgi:uncharacterized protein (DUF2132 family)